MERGQECPRNIGHGRLPHQQGAPGHWASVPHAQQQLHYHLARDSVEELQVDEQNLRAFLILRLCDLLSQPRLHGQSHPEGSAHTPSSPVHGGLGQYRCVAAMINYPPKTCTPLSIVPLLRQGLYFPAPLVLYVVMGLLLTNELHEK